MDDIDTSQYLPLSEATFYVLACLHEPLHGYAIMQKVDALSEGSVSIGPGTLYGVFAALEKQGLILKLREEERRKVYGMTALGRRVLAGQARRLSIMAAAANNTLALLGEKA
ncbi:PadR family transcriptional regulator [Janthinobacterium sp. RB2R34]|uniref:PadR family transcriptional regulator n=1 Tax=Janthinobacterium sp. RB2R34 TaxID=3424193 RepID=UPI003F234EFC